MKVKVWAYPKRGSMVTTHGELVAGAVLVVTGDLHLEKGDRVVLGGADDCQPWPECSVHHVEAYHHAVGDTFESSAVLKRGNP